MTHQHLGDFGDFSLSVVVTSPPWYENCFLVLHKPSRALAVVDPGGDGDSLLDAVKALDGKAEVILLTHGHPDHLGAAHQLETALGVPTRAHADEASVIASSSELNREFTGQPQMGPASLETFDGEPTLTLGGAPLRVIHTPGHTPGGVCFDFGAFVLTGDTLFRNGVGRTDLPGGSEQQLWTSITRLLGMVSEDAMLYSGHGPDWSARDARRWWRMVG
ncbi:MBL fold metallo-hydrolase [Magnetospirillum sp. SS-4]|uniref:MBL fold metallo-hydrolase n=1 Tax=Magnetospirillum sp. SS-4 TaxID=2681465 RepID=UPI00137CAE0C|nr:MBL fold metallo-hydrolase [Magnetospirillum sp. SS-4]CAA7627521.1 Zn-dependent hydrolase [Magnetospirillum sp. SS-4]